VTIETRSFRIWSWIADNWTAQVGAAMSGDYGGHVSLWQYLLNNDHYFWKA